MAADPGKANVPWGDEPARDLGEWKRIWDQDVRFPVRGRPGLLGKISVWFKRALRPFIKAPTADLWDRQRVFNQILLDHLAEREQRVQSMLDEAASETEWRVQEMRDQTVLVSRLLRDGLQDVMHHNDALFARVDQKLDRYRRDSRDLRRNLEHALAHLDGGPEGAASALNDALETSIGGDSIGRFASPSSAEEVLSLLPDEGPILQLGCDHHELLELLKRKGIPARGVDSSAALVGACRERGLEVDEGDPSQALAGCDADTLAAVVSLQMLERVPVELADRIVRSAYRALRPGGVLVLETANPASLVTASDFWRNPRHLRPVHPEILSVLYTESGFQDVRRVDLHPFGERERLPELPLDGLEGSARDIAGHINLLRDRLDELLYGYRAYALVGVKPD